MASNLSSVLGSRALWVIRQGDTRNVPLYQSPLARLVHRNAAPPRLPVYVPAAAATETAVATNPEARRFKPTDPSGQSAQPGFGSPLRGCPEPLGATLDITTATTNIALFSSNCTGVTLCLFTESDLMLGRITHQIPLDPDLNCTGDVWHIALPDVRPDLLYGFRVSGPTPEDEPPAESPPADPTPSDDSDIEVVKIKYAAGQGFDDSCVLIDPYAKAIFNGRKRFGQMGADLSYGAPDVLGYAPTWPQAAAALPGATPPFDWEGDRPLGRPMEDLIVYEAHVRGFTAHQSSGVEHPGTYSGLTQRLDYLQSLGVTALELMPIHEFNELEYYDVAPAGGGPSRYNFWGYSTVGFFAPMARYSSTFNDAKVGAGAAAGGAINEFKTLVKECHLRGIEVILDVVFNHTAEGNENGLTLSFRGIDNRVYYMLAPGGECYNYSGCGNTFNCNHPVARRFIMDCLKHWVEEYHIDGFRFDLGSIMTRAHSHWHPADFTGVEGEEGADADAAGMDGGAESSGESTTVASAPFSGGAVVNEDGIMTNGAGVPTGMPLSDPPLIAEISSDPVLAHTKLIAEAWDCDGLNQVGAFPHYGGRWSEWNGHFRDATRQFIKGTDGGWAGAFASAICGSPNIYVSEPGEHDWWGNNGGRRWKGGRGPTASVNFVTAHDGFTLADLVSYNEKHNEDNGESNADGESHNLSWNCGEEGPSNDPSVVSLRARQTRNFITALLVSHGVPMMVMGDEYGHSKGGNNNTYCHDSPLNYFDWDAARNDADGLLRFTRHMIAFRKKHKELRRATYVTDADVEWHGTTPDEPDWEDTSRFLAFSLKGAHGVGSVYVAFNTGHTPEMVKLPEMPGRVWQPVVDTGKAAPYDILVADERLPDAEVAATRAAVSMWTLEHCYPMLPWSCIVLESVSVDAQAVMPDERRQELRVPGPAVPANADASKAKTKAGSRLKSTAGKRATKAVQEP